MGSLRFASAELKADRDVVFAALEASGGYALQFASAELKADPWVALVAVAQTGDALQWAADDLKAGGLSSYLLDLAIARSAVRQLIAWSSPPVAVVDPALDDRRQISKSDVAET